MFFPPYSLPNMGDYEIPVHFLPIPEQPAANALYSQDMPYAKKPKNRKGDFLLGTKIRAGSTEHLRYLDGIFTEKKGKIKIALQQGSPNLYNIVLKCLENLAQECLKIAEKAADPGIFICKSAEISSFLQTSWEYDIARGLHLGPTVAPTPQVAPPAVSAEMAPPVFDTSDGSTIEANSLSPLSPLELLSSTAIKDLSKNPIEPPPADKGDTGLPPLVDAEPLSRKVKKRIARKPRLNNTGNGIPKRIKASDK